MSETQYLGILDGIIHNARFRLDQTLDGSFDVFRDGGGAYVGALFAEEGFEHRWTLKCDTSGTDISVDCEDRDEAFRALLAAYLDDDPNGKRWRIVLDFDGDE